MYANQQYVHYLCHIAHFAVDLRYVSKWFACHGNLKCHLRDLDVRNHKPCLADRRVITVIHGTGSSRKEMRNGFAFILYVAPASLHAGLRISVSITVARTMYCLVHTTA